VSWHGRVEIGEQPGEGALPAVLLFAGSVVVLALQDGQEFEAGGEEAAVLADRFERAVQFGRAGAVAVAEQPERRCCVGDLCRAAGRD
jgi:hypothetical protein